MMRKEQEAREEEDETQFQTKFEAVSLSFLE